MKSASLAAMAVLLISCFALTNTATASNTVDFSNGGGALSGTNAGLSLSGSTLIAVTGLNGGGTITGNLGSVSFTTGALISGSLSREACSRAEAHSPSLATGQTEFPMEFCFLAHSPAM